MAVRTPALTHGIDRQIADWVDGHEGDLLSVASDMVAIPSENRPPTGGELPFQRFFADRMTSAGMDVTSFLLGDVPGLPAHPMYWPGRDYRDRPVVVGRLPGSGGGRSLLLTGHGDVVPGVAGTHAPFDPTIEQGRLYGRGASDMKGGLAAALMAARCLRDLEVELGGDLLIESVVDEEMGGANGTLASRLMGVTADGALMLEPSNLTVCASHLGGRVFRITVTGHGGMGFGGGDLRNPIGALARLIRVVEDFGLIWGRQDPPAGIPPVQGALGTMMSVAIASDFEPGTATGIPREAILEVWVETFPGTTAEDLDAAFIGHCERAVASDPALSGFEIGFDHLTRFLPGTGIPIDHDFVRSVVSGLARVDPGLDRAVMTAPFACDAFVLNGLGVPTVVLGPSGDRAHSADEYVTCDSLITLTKAIALTAVDWCSLAREQEGGRR